MAATLNKKWTLLTRPQGMVKVTDFELKEEPIPEIKEGEYLVKVIYLSFDPAQRGWMKRDTYLPAIELGHVIRSFGGGEVIESKNEQYKKGDFVTGLTGWQEYVVGKKGEFNLVVPGIPLTVALNQCGLVGLTAYFGLLQVGGFKEGDTVVVSGAAGATGSIVGQIAKIKNARVIGIAGGADKTKLLKEKLHFDEAIDYKSEDVSKRLKELVPKGIDLFFDNVGGEILDSALENLALHARVVICGGISGYNSEVKGPRQYLNLIVKRAKMEGFIVTDFAKDFPGAIKEIATWTQEGKLTAQEDIQHGFENVPTTFLRLFTGANFGKQLLKI